MTRAEGVRRSKGALSRALEGKLPLGMDLGRENLELSDEEEDFELKVCRCFTSLLYELRRIC